MKNFLCFVIAAILSVPCFAQSSAVPPKRANTILVALPDSGVVAWQSAVRAALGRGFVLKNNSKEFLTFSTELLSVKPGLQVGVSGFVRGRTVVLTGIFLVPGFDTVPNAIVRRGMAGSPFMDAWVVLEELAKSLSTSISYEAR